MTLLLRSFQAALVAFTRIPASSSHLHTSHFQYSHYFLPLIGLLIGGCLAIIFNGLITILPLSTSIILCLIASVILTGALHEDGFADCCDGFGGGNSTDKTLAIMKDSRLGTYGVIGLIGLLSLKYSLLQAINPPQLAVTWIAISMLGRMSPLIVMHLINHIPSTTAKMSSQLETSPLLLCISIIFTLASLAFFYPALPLLILSIATVICSTIASAYFQKRIQGYNGDCLGAAEQITEVALLLVLYAFSRQAISL